MGNFIEAKEGRVSFDRESIKELLEYICDGFWHSLIELHGALGMQHNTINKNRHYLKKMGYSFEKRRVNYVEKTGKRKHYFLYRYCGKNSATVSV